MAMRVVEARLPAGAGDRIGRLLVDHPGVEAWAPEEAVDVHRFLIDAGDVEAFTDALREQFGERRLVVLPVEATVPDVEANFVTATPANGMVGRVSREELMQDVEDRIRLNPVFLALAALSVGVAAIGFLRDDVVALVASMVIAPLLGPNVGLALAATLGDVDLARRSLRAGLAGLGLSFLLAVGLGALLGIDPDAPEVAKRAAPGLADLALAVLSGIAATLAFTTALPSSLIGVMVAVALLPALVAGGMLLGAGHVDAAIGAFVLLGTNLAALNLAGVVTFLAQGVHSGRWWDEDHARAASRRAIFAWAAVLVALGLLLWFGPWGL